MKQTILALTAMLLTPLAALRAAEPIEIGSHRQLFLDDHIVERIEGLKRTMHQPQKRGAVLKADRPWEGVYIGIFSPPMWVPEEGVYKQVYECRYDQRGQRRRYALATSQDGVHWQKPNLGLVEFDGSMRNNLFPTPDNQRLVHVVYDPDDPDPRRRYKGLLTVPRGRIPVVSEDGFDWKKLDVELPSGDAGTMTFDREKRLFLALLKRENPNTVGRSYDVSISRDFVEWSVPRFMFGMDKGRDQEMALDIIRRRLVNPALAKPLFVDPPGGGGRIPTWQAECYNFGVVPYEGLYLGLITVYYPTGERLPDRRNADGFNLIQLAMSRDFENWRRLGDRQPFLEPSPLTRGLVGNYDRLQLGAYNGIILHDDEVRFYYGGNKRRVPQHDRWPDGSPRDPSTLSESERADWLEDTHSAMHLTVLRRDGFVSLNAGAESGRLITKPLIVSGETLLLNVAVRAGGYATVTVLGDDGEPLPGFERSVPLKADSIDQLVSWPSSGDVGRLTSQPIRLRIELKEADLYSFRFTD